MKSWYLAALIFIVFKETPSDYFDIIVNKMKAADMKAELIKAKPHNKKKKKGNK